MKKALLVATVQSHIAQFHRPLIRVLKEAGYEVHVAARDNLAEKNGLTINNIDKKFNVGFERSPFSLKNLKAYRDLKRIIENNHYDIISCNTPVGGMLTRIAARRARKRGTKVYYTAHGFHFYKGAPLKNWLIYYPIEKIMAKQTDKLLSICEEDYLLCKKTFKTECHRIHGVGADVERYQVIDDNVKQELRSVLGIQQDEFVAICVGELNTNKNQRTIIEAVPMIIEIIPNFKLLLAGNGPMREILEALIKELGVVENVVLLGYRSDLEKYVKASDIGISASIREGLGLNLIEQMMCEKPVLGSRNRGHNELIEDGINGFLFNPKDSKEISEKVCMLYDNCVDRKKMGEAGRKKATCYTSVNVTKELENIYDLRGV